MLTVDTTLQNRYRIIRQLGEGGMGTVYEAVDQKFDSTVALKVTYLRDERLHKQFEIEARLLNRLRHPALPRVFDHFTEGDGKYLIMDFIEGKDLLDRIQERGDGFPLEDVLSWADQLLDTLNYLHNQKPPIIHRDIKLTNLKLSDDGRIFLLDFGLAKGAREQTVIPTKTVLGYSLPYSPLEQLLQVDQQWVELLSVANSDKVADILKKGTNERSDIFSLGATLSHLITSKIPPAAPIRALSLWSGSIDPLPALFDERVPRKIVDILTKAMELNPDNRIASADAMRKVLQDAGQALRIDGKSNAKTIPNDSTIPAPPPPLPPEPKLTPQPEKSISRRWLVLSIIAFLVTVFGLASRSIKQRYIPPTKQSENSSAGISNITPTYTPSIMPSATSSKPAASPSEQPDLTGTWTGKLDGDPASLIIDKKEGDIYYGTLIVGDYQIAVNASIASNPRQVTIQETKVLKGKGWALGKDIGSLSSDGKLMNGRGIDRNHSYKWSFTREQ